MRSRGLKFGVRVVLAQSLLLRLLVDTDDRRIVSGTEAVLLKLLGLVDTVDPTFDERSSSNISDSESESPFGEEESLEGDPLLCNLKGARNVVRLDRDLSCGIEDNPTDECRRLECSCSMSRPLPLGEGTPSRCVRR